MSVSSTSAAVDGPALNTSTIHSTVSPFTTLGVVVRLLTWMSACEVAPPMSVPVLLVVLDSPPPEIVAVLTIVAAIGSCTMASTKIGG